MIIRSLGKLKTCRNCGDLILSIRKIPLCAACRRTYGVGAFVGGIVAGIVLKVLEHWS